MRKRLSWHQALAAENFEVIADAAAKAMFVVDGRIDDTPSAKVTGNEILATRAFKRALRQELTARGYRVSPKPREVRP